MLNFKRKTHKKTSAFLAVIGIVLLLYAALMILFIWWGFTTSVKAVDGAVNLFRKNQFGWPEGWIWEWNWSNYSTVLKNIYVDVYLGVNDDKRVPVGALAMLGNSLIYAFGGAFISTAVPTIVAYASAKTPFKFNGVLDAVIIACMAIPIVGSQPSELQVLATLNLYDTWAGYLLQKGHFISMYYLIMKAAFKSVPVSFSEAAQIEGAGHYSIMFKIVMPVVRNVILTIFLLIFVENWNAYNYTLIYLPSYPTLAYGVFYLVFLNGALGLRNPPMQMAASFVLFTPMLILFLCLRDVLMQNLSMGGVKE